MNKRKSILDKIKKGKTISSISDELEMSVRTVEAMVDSMKHQGYLKEIKCDESKCNSCPMGCNSSKMPFKIYRLTEKREEL